MQFNKSKDKNGKTYQSVLLCKKYRDAETGNPKIEVVLNLSKYGLDNKTLTCFYRYFSPMGLKTQQIIKLNKRCKRVMSVI